MLAYLLALKISFANYEKLSLRRNRLRSMYVRTTRKWRAKIHKRRQEKRRSTTANTIDGERRRRWSKIEIFKCLRIKLFKVSSDIERNVWEHTFSHKNCLAFLRAPRLLALAGCWWNAHHISVCIPNFVLFVCALCHLNNVFKWTRKKAEKQQHNVAFWNWFDVTSNAILMCVCLCWLGDFSELTRKRGGPESKREVESEKTIRK